MVKQTAVASFSSYGHLGSEIRVLHHRYACHMCCFIVDVWLIGNCPDLPLVLWREPTLQASYESPKAQSRGIGTGSFLAAKHHSKYLAKKTEQWDYVCIPELLNLFFLNLFSDRHIFMFYWYRVHKMTSSRFPCNGCSKGHHPRHDAFVDA